MITPLRSSVVAFWLLSTGLSGAAQTPATCPSLLNHTMARLQDGVAQNLCQYAGKVVLAVNTASYCGFTPQYQGLEALYAKYKDQGLVVLGFPSNDFKQEKASNQEIAEFCYNTYGVAFPMFEASHVRGDKANPLFKALASQGAGSPKWNFYKYLIDRQGRVVDSYSSMTVPASLEATVVEALKGQR